MGKKKMSERTVGWFIDGQPGQYTVKLADGTLVGTFQYLNQIEQAADKAFAWLKFTDIDAHIARVKQGRKLDMTNPVKIKTVTAPEDIAKINAMVGKLREKMIYLAGRWMDEHEYEDINDYNAAIMGELPEGFTLTKMTTRPFGFYFTIWTGAVYHYFVKAKTLGWKRVK
jgi:hypothetical protein